jgi:tetratricopeptide (TPR) repeat protein
MAQTNGVEILLDEAYGRISALDLVAAKASLDKALQIDFDHQELLYAMKCTVWWLDVLKRSETYRTPFEEGEFLVGRCKAFRLFTARLGTEYTRCILAFKQFAFGVAITKYESMHTDMEQSDPELLLRLGRAYKGRGEYETAIKFLEILANTKRDDSAVLADLGDAYAMINESRRAKALFREAFFINPQRIDLELLESGLITRLAEKATEAGREGIEIAEWIPVYGEILGVLSVKRELKPIEAGKLKQSIYELETELSADGARRPILLPRLVNRYFWLIDYYLNQKEEKARIDELLLKIKLLDSNVHKMYIA